MPSATLFLSPPPPPPPPPNNPNLKPNPNPNPNPNLPHHRPHNTHLSSSNKTQPLLPMPTAPWMTSPLLLPPDDLPKSRTPKTHHRNNHHHNPLTQTVRGGRGKRAMRGIVDSIARLQGTVDPRRESEVEVAGFGVSLDGEGVSTPPPPPPPWAKAERVVFRREKKVRELTEAERRLPGELLGRLRREAMGLGRWVKVRKAGVTEEVVEKIKEGWGEGELVMVRFGVPLCRNMDRAREIVEEMTGGLVVWSKKDALVIYRGCNYHNASVPSGISWESEEDNHVSTVKSNAIINRATITENQEESPFVAGTALEINNDTLPINETLYEREANRLLDGLGPRYTNWWCPKPLPVDGDMLPEVVPGFRPPFRRCPPHLRPKLTDDELTYLRKLARPLPTHFVLGRNSKLQGLAAAIIKVWEKCSIVKIALKYGIPNTNNEMMAWELKLLTGGVLILRNKFFIILYRGKDFLPGRVANLIFKREKELDSCQLQEEDARLKAFRSLHNMDKYNDTLPSASMGEACSEFQYIQTKLGDVGDYEFDPKVQIEAEKERLEKEIRKQERRLSILQMKLERSENELAKLNSSWKPGEKVADQELITEEERQTFRRIGLKMDQLLLLGRRGIYDGVIGSMHQHWKHREVVKVITMQRDYSQIIQTARLLENESGGLLVAVEKLKRGHAIIIYRGKNYYRPLKFLPENLLTKREALQQSMEMQRRGSLKFFARLTAQIISDLKDRLGNLEGRNEAMMSGTSENQK